LAKKLPLYGELHRFIPVLASIEGARMTEMIVKHRARVAGTSNYTMSRTVKVISDLVLVFFLKKYLIKPMHFFGKIAVWMILIGLGIGGTMGVRWWSHPEMTLGSLPMLSAIFLLAGIHFMGMGIIAELVMRNLHESRGKKPYTIRRMYFPKTQLK
jgi:hypothetical protein